MKKFYKKLILLLCFLLIYLFSATTALASDHTYVIEEPELLKMVDSPEMQAKEECAIEKYNSLLQKWSAAQVPVNETSLEYPDFYGGAYIDEEKNLVILVTDDNTDIRKYFSEIIDLSNVLFEKVEYSYARLLSEKVLIEKKAFSANKNLINSEIVAIGLDIKNNSISIYVNDSAENIKSAKGNQSLSSQLTTFKNVVIIPNSSRAQTLSTTVRPGVQIKKSSGGERSVGFWARKNNGDIGIVTAPHNSISHGTAIYTRGGTFFGYASTSIFGGKLDATFIKKSSNVAITTNNTPMGWSFGLKSNAYCSLPVGATVYSSGYNHYSGYGTVEDANYSINYISEDVILTDVVKTSVIVTGGDSGGLVAASGNNSSRYVAGIITGGVKNANNQYEMIYVKMSNIITSLGVHVY